MCQDNTLEANVNTVQVDVEGEYLLVACNIEDQIMQY